MAFNLLSSIRDLVYQGTFKYKYRIRWVLVVVVFLSAVLLYQFDLLRRIELLSLDCRFRLKPVKTLVSDIVFIDMAEDSIQAIGRWPWPRSWHAALIKALSESKPKAIIFDVLFSESQDESDDMALEEAIKASGYVYLPLLFDLKEQDPIYLDKSGGVLAVVEPLERFARYTKGEGHINAIPDVDGILRRVPPKISFKDISAYQLGLKSALDILGASDADISFSPKRHAILAKLPGNKSLNIPLDNNNQFIINWKQKWGKEFKHFSYVDVIRSYAMVKKGLEPIIDLSVFKDKICVVGLTAAGLTDIKPVPVQNAYPAVGINAMIINSVLAKDFIYDLPKWCNILILLLVSIAITFYLSNLRLIGGMILAVASIACYISISALMFVLFNVAITTIYPAMAIFLSYTFTSLYAQILQSIERARLFKQATRDGLTSLYNIRHFNLLFEAEFRNLVLDKTKRLALIMGDVDNFKQVNDTYGHQAGDIILREFAKIIQAKCRQTDIVARYGGEEFIVMLPGAGKKEAMETAERIRHDIEGRKFRLKNIVYGTTISMGVVEFSNEREKDSLIEKADKALYQAKHEGKNRVCLSSI